MLDVDDVSELICSRSDGIGVYDGSLFNESDIIFCFSLEKEKSFKKINCLTA
jgi:hypothetical protein